MGSIAHFRQAMLDADHLPEARRLLRGTRRRPAAVRPGLEGTSGRADQEAPVWWEANTRDEIHRALDLADEFGTTAVIVGGREAAKVADRLKAAKVPVVLRLNFPEEPRVPTEEEYRKKAGGRARRAAPRAGPPQGRSGRNRSRTAAALAKAAFRSPSPPRASSGSTRSPAVVRQLITAGLDRRRRPGRRSPRTPRRSRGVDRRLGTLEPGKLGHLIAMTAPFSDERAKVGTS